ncbi:MAG: prepilin-type N-terminal cleavage/methylation domain-containing protein [Planctomycetaceae bacterium]|nr:prepilin-type N-terminal cleavage/methylation domain-containing protein [Planctomycetaceae bacterium]
MRKGFTLIELLTVVAIIAMLMAIFGVGARKMKVIQRNLQQKAVFHGMEIGLELFSKDFDGYPDSESILDGTVICGAQRLTEALFGRDERGFNPKTKWHPTRDMAAAPLLYTESTEKNRKGPYTELKHGEIHTIAELWGPSAGIYDSAGASTPTQRAPVITDVFAYNVVPNLTEKVGTPILYFKANSTKRFRMNAANVPVPDPAETEYTQWVFNYNDNAALLGLNWLREVQDPAPSAGLTKHYKDPGDNTKSNVQVFYESLTERQADMNSDGKDDFFKAFNSGTFVLISAGYDGIYGTKDDVTNFNY